MPNATNQIVIYPCLLLIKRCNTTQRGGGVDAWRHKMLAAERIERNIQTTSHLLSTRPPPAIPPLQPTGPHMQRIPDRWLSTPPPSSFLNFSGVVFPSKSTTFDVRYSYNHIASSVRGEIKVHRKRDLFEKALLPVRPPPSSAPKPQHHPLCYTQTDTPTANSAEQ